MEVSSATSKVSIRLLQRTDAKKASRVIRKNLDKVNSECYPMKVIDFMKTYYSPENLQKFTKEENRINLVATNDSKIIGTGSLVGNEVKMMFVDPEMHGKGIGKKLIERIEYLAKLNKISTLKLHSSINAENFYARLGYVRSGVESDDQFGTAIVMSKQL